MKLDKGQIKALSRVSINLSQATFIALVIGRIATPEKISTFAFIQSLIKEK
ncbi:MAG: hypothetical protein ACK4JE_04555 [Endomicrobiia bacterium]